MGWLMGRGGGWGTSEAHLFLQDRERLLPPADVDLDGLHGQQLGLPLPERLQHRLQTTGACSNPKP